MIDVEILKECMDTREDQYHEALVDFCVGYIEKSLPDIQIEAEKVELIRLKYVKAKERYEKCKK